MCTIYAAAFLVVSGSIWLWEITFCPYCKRKHRHGGGGHFDVDPRGSLSHRVSHCDTPGISDGGYVLVDASPPTTRALIKSTRLASLPKGCAT